MAEKVDLHNWKDIYLAETWQKRMFVQTLWDGTVLLYT